MPEGRENACVNFISSKIIFQKGRQVNNIFRQGEKSPPVDLNEQKYLGKKKRMPDRTREIQETNTQVKPNTYCSYKITVIVVMNDALKM